ncbi:MAG: EamA family transporter [archaeon]
MKKHTNRWFLYGCGTALSMAAFILTYKKILLSGISPLVLIFFIFIFTFLGFAGWALISRPKIKFSWIVLGWFIAAAIASLLGNYFEALSLRDAPNPGYTSSLKYLQIIIITLFAPFLFGSKINLKKVLGIVLVLGGLFLIVI